jgi:hypothetical protein
VVGEMSGEEFAAHINATFQWVETFAF